MSVGKKNPFVTKLHVILKAFSFSAFIGYNGRSVHLVIALLTLFYIYLMLLLLFLYVIFQMFHDVNYISNSMKRYGRHPLSINNFNLSQVPMSTIVRNQNNMKLALHGTNISKIIFANTSKILRFFDWLKIGVVQYTNCYKLHF